MKKIIEFIHNNKDYLYYYFLFRNLSEMKSVLDVGCGSNSPLSKISKKPYSVGFDLFEPSLKKSKKQRIHTKYVVGNILELEKHFKNRAFDCVIGLDIIEHFTKKEGNKLLATMEDVAKSKVIVFTPNGFVKQSVYDNNIYQIHKSGWTVTDFQKRGYRVFGLRGPRWLRGEYASIKYKPWFFWGLVAFLTEPFYVFFPKSAYHLFAVKNIEHE